MKVGEIIELLSKPENTIASIAKSIDGVGEKKLRDAIREAGYEFRNKGEKGWHFIGEGEQPIDKSVFEFIPSSSVKRSSTISSHNNSHNVNSKRNRVKEDVKQDSQFDSHGSESNFTKEEMEALKEMLSEYMREKEHQTKRDILHKRIMMLEKGEKTRKTIVISDSVGAKLDKFAGETRFNKSDLVEIAILDLINRYE